jgi:addiction module HigA family antidote
LDNVHPGDILREDFLIGSEIGFAEVAEGTGIDIEVLKEIVASCRDIDAETNLRLALYFRMSEGFFLGLQNDYDIEEVRRAQADELDRIVPRAA